MKAFFITFLSLVFSSTALAATTQSTAISVDSLGIALLLIVGLVCLVIARRRIL